MIQLSRIKTVINANRALVLVLVLTLALRAYSLNAPFSGHHYEKETIHAAEAENLLKDRDFWHLKMYYPGGSAGYYGEFVSYLTFAMFYVFGVHEWAARLPMLLFGVFSVYLLYRIVGLLYARQHAIYASFLFAVAPLYVYFSRYLGAESPAVFFMLLSIFFFLKWLKTEKKSHVLVSSVAMAFLGHQKYVFLYLFGVYALFLLLRRSKKLGITFWSYFGAAFLMPFAWKYLLYGSYKLPSAILQYAQYAVFFEARYYQNIVFMLGGGLSPLILLLFGVGTCYALRKLAEAELFLIMWLLGGAAYYALTGHYGFIHDYYLLMVVPPACAIASLSLKSAAIRKNKTMLALVVLAMSLPLSYYVYSIRYPDAEAGKYLGNRTQANEWVLGSPAVSYYSKRNITGFGSLDQFKQNEKTYNFRYMVVPSGGYYAAYGRDEAGRYISERYSLEKKVCAKPRFFTYHLVTNKTDKGLEYGYRMSLQREPNCADILRRNL